jgi:hypothetical protein
MPTPNRFVLLGRVVTMDDAFTVVDDGALYVDANHVAAVLPAKAPPPAGFENALRVRTGGTLYPGLIDIHNHLSYNALRLWRVPQRFDNRAQWARHREYAQLVTGPMGVLGRSDDPEILPALVTYVECKCLFGGTTTSQGIALASNAGVRAYYKGSIRVVEGASQPGMPRANSHIADVATREWPNFFGDLQDATCLLLHLSEGLGPSARQHFLHLRGPEDKWAILEALAGIHCGGLEADDFGILAANQGTMVWSPLSNLLLYGGTANVKSAKEHGVTMALGPDWSPTGSKNLLGELKVAKLVSQSQGDLFSDRDVVSMVTRNPAKILKWTTAVGSLEPGKRADVLVVRGAKDDPYASLIAASESHVDLVVIDGLPRFGSTKLMRALGSDGEHVTISGNLKLANIGGGQPSVVKTLPISDAKSILSKALRDLPKANDGLPPQKPRAASDEPTWYLALDEETSDAQALSGSGDAGGLGFPGELAAAAPPLPFVALELDPISMSDDGKFLETIGMQPNLPDFVRRGLPKFF